MERFRSLLHGPASRVFVAVTLIAAFACGDPYLHTNPYDPDVPVTITISGPDTLFSLGQIAVFSAQAAPAFPDTSVQWIADTVTVFNGTRDTVVDGANYLQADGTGAFQSILPPLDTSNDQGLDRSVLRRRGHDSPAIHPHAPRLRALRNVQDENVSSRRVQTGRADATRDAHRASAPRYACMCRANWSAALGQCG